MSEPGSSSSLLVQSGLVSAEQLEDCQRALGDSADEAALLQRLIERRFLTKWQARQIKTGRTSGFFLEHYKLLAPLGAGGMGQVFRALNTQVGREVAVKVLPRRRAPLRWSSASAARPWPPCGFSARTSSAPSSWGSKRIPTSS